MLAHLQHNWKIAAKAIAAESVSKGVIRIATFTKKKHCLVIHRSTLPEVRISKNKIERRARIIELRGRRQELEED